MALSVLSNRSSLIAQRNLRQANNALERNFERLSSGLRINSARDDPAGLSITTRFTARIRGFGQALRNVNDGISLAQTGDSALQDVGDVLQRMRELAVQAATDLNSDEDRASLQTEVGQLVGEVERITTDTKFNGLGLFNGDVLARRLHVGPDARQQLMVTIQRAQTDQIGRHVRVTGAAVDTTGISFGDVALNGVSLRGTVAADDTLSTANNAGSAIAIAAAVDDSEPYSGVQGIVGEASVTAGAVAAGGVLDAVDYITINGQDITGITVQVADADSALVDAINAEADTTGVYASRDANSRVVLNAPDGRNIEVTTTTAAAATRTGFNGGAATTNVTGATVTLRSMELVKLTVNVAAASGATGFGAGAGDYLYGIDASNALSSVDVSTRAGANRSIDVLDAAIEQVSALRAGLGALSNRLESTAGNLSTSSENLITARGRIQDADFASEAASLARNTVLRTASASLLAQANVSGNIALKLLD